MDFGLVKKVIRLLKAKKKLADVVEIEIESKRIDDLIKKYNYKVYISSIPKRLITPFSIHLYQPLKIKSPIFVQTISIDYQLVDKKIDHLIKMMKWLAPLIHIL